MMCNNPTPKSFSQFKSKLQSRVVILGDAKDRVVQEGALKINDYVHLQILR